MRLVAVCVAVVAGAVLIPAVSDARMRTLEVVTSGDGTVVSTDRRIDCGADCSARYGRHELVRLRARPSRNFRFAHWTGDCVGRARICVVALARSTAVTATFTRKRRPVRILVGGPGTVSVDSTTVRCGSTASQCEGKAGQETTIRLTATPDPGAVFDSWTAGACAGASSATCDVVVPAGPVEIGALFRRATPGVGLQTLTLNQADVHARSTPAGIDCPDACSASFAANTHVTLHSVPDVVWTAGCVGRGHDCTVVMDAPVTADGRLLPPPTETSGFGLTLTVSGPGRVVGASLRCHGLRGSIGDCRDSFSPGTRLKLRAVPDKGARLQHWWGFCSGRKPQCPVTVSTSKTIGAVFRR